MDSFTVKVHRIGLIRCSFLSKSDAMVLNDIGKCCVLVPTYYIPIDFNEGYFQTSAKDKLAGEQ